MLQGDLCDDKGRLILCYRETCVMIKVDLSNVTGRLV